MATRKVEETANVKRFRVQVVTNPDFCGIDSGGVQFAHGEAIIYEGRMVEWFKEHEGYEVSEIAE